MSGRKYSEFRLQREREEKLKLAQDIGNLHSEVSALQKRVVSMLEEASEGLRTTFAQEVQQAQRWLDQLDPPHVKGLGIDTDLSVLQATCNELEQIAGKARQVRETLAVAFTQKADEMGKRLVRRLAEVERAYIGHRQLLELWSGPSRVQEWDNALQLARQMLNAEKYAPLEVQLKETEKQLDREIKWGKEQEDKHQKRLYLLKALRQVCAEMGFDEVAGPQYEQQENRASNVVYTVDTLDRGKIQFTLSLERISSFSEIADERCFEEFGKLSQYLQDQFGIHTGFYWPGEQPPPIGNADEEKVLPNEQPAAQVLQSGAQGGM